MSDFKEIASIRFGNVRFLIKQTPEAEEYFAENLPEDEINKLMPSAQTWYSQVLDLLGLDHKQGGEGEDVEAVIYSIVSDDEKEIINNQDKVKDFQEFIESPLGISDNNRPDNEKKIRIKFALRVKKKEK